MAGKADIEASQSASLLRIQQVRGRRARQELADATLARAVAVRSLENARAMLHRMTDEVAQAARERWDDALETLLPAKVLTALREAEAADLSKLQCASKEMAEAEAEVNTLSRTAAAAAETMAKVGRVTLRRERLAADRNGRMHQQRMQGEEAALESDLPNHGIGST